MRFTASKAMGEISLASLPFLTLPSTSANSKNFRRAWLQHKAEVTGPGDRFAS